MASGPIISGTLAVLLPSRALIIPPLLISCIALIFLVLIAAVNVDTPLATSPLPLASESAPLLRASLPLVAASPPAPIAASTVDSGGRADFDSHKGLPPKAGEGGPVHEEPPSLRASVIVQVAMLLFGVSRNFLKFGFESAMVVVYDRQFYFTPGTSGIIAGSCALSTVFSLFLYKGFCAKHVGTHRLLLIAEATALAAAALMIATDAPLGGSTSGVSLAAAAGLTHDDHIVDIRTAELLTLGASILFYPAMYLGASIGNSHPLRFAVEGHPLLSRSSMLAQQEILQKTIGKGLGMVYCRTALGDPPHLASLGRFFMVIVTTQVVLLAVCFDPRETRQALQAALRSMRRVAQGSRGGH
mmetsp:Transcript_19364/g.49511  ORF Transcript_19364/g.49511 Transcript_19364/m.49511 type:complete len:358 (+) Transcript_19364:1-1074(+)